MAEAEGVFQVETFGDFQKSKFGKTIETNFFFRLVLLLESLGRRDQVFGISVTHDELESLFRKVSLLADCQWSNCEQLKSQKQPVEKRNLKN